MLTTTEEMPGLSEAEASLLAGLARYPLARKAMLGVIAQAPGIDAALQHLLYTQNPRTGEPYISVVVPPPLFGRRAARVYRSEYAEALKPFLAPRPYESLAIVGERSRERQNILSNLMYYPVLNPSLMQSALGTSASFFTQDLRYLIEKRIVSIWHPNLLVEEKYEEYKQKIAGDVTYRGVRYFLTEYEDRLRPFLR